MEHRRLESDLIVPNSKITVFLDALSKMSKNPTIDCELSQVLGEFLAKLHETDTYLENGLVNINFAEAAFVVQNAAALYGKKVDLLWDMTFDYQKKLILAEENTNTNEEIEKIEERKRKYKRKRRTNPDQNQTAQLVNNYSFGNVENIDYLNQNYETVDLYKEWGKFQTQQTFNSSVFSNKKFTFLPIDNIYNENNDYIGRYNQFHTTSMFEEIFHLEEQGMLSDGSSCISKMRIDCYVKNDFFHKNSISVDTPEAAYLKELNKYLDNFLHCNKEKDTEFSPNNNTHSSGILCKKSYVSLERLSVDLIRSKLRRGSVADSLLSDDQISTISLNCGENDNSGKNTGVLESRSKSCSQDSAFYEDLVEQEADSVYIETSDPLTEESTEIVFRNSEMDSNLSKTDEANSTNIPVMTQELSHVDSKSENVTIIKKRKSRIAEDVTDKEKSIQRKKLQKRRRIVKIAPLLTSKYRDFEIFCRLHYRAEDGEGTPLSEVSDSEPSDEEDENEESSDSPVEENVSDNEETVVEKAESEIGEDPELPSQQSENLPSTTNFPPSFSSSCMSNAGIGTTSTPKSSGHHLPNFSLEDTEQEEISRNIVKEWRSFIVPKLRAMENRADFDIYKYSSTIIEPMAIGEEKSFKDLVKGKNASEVARFFIATLQLANTNNIEIAGSVPGELGNDTVKIKLIDKTQHHELLEEYQAPSQETFRQRLNNVKKALNSKSLSKFSSGSGPPNKKPKVS